MYIIALLVCYENKINNFLMRVFHIELDIKKLLEILMMLTVTVEIHYNFHSYDDSVTHSFT